MKFRTELHTASEDEYQAAIELIDSKPTLSLSELTSLVNHSDERVLIKLIRAARGNSFILWAIYDRSHREAELAGESWNTVLDAASQALRSRPIAQQEEASPEGRPSPSAQARSLGEWAYDAPAADIEGALKSFGSLDAQGAILRSAAKITLEIVERNIPYGPLSEIAENPKVALDPEMSQALANWAAHEIANEEYHEAYAAGVLRNLLSNGYQISQQEKDFLMMAAGRVGTVDHDDDEEEPYNRCVPALEVFSHPSFSLTPTEWKEILHQMPLEKPQPVIDLMNRPDVPADALSFLLVRLQRNSWHADSLLPELLAHPQFDSPENRKSYLSVVMQYNKRGIIPRLTPSEFWDHLLDNLSTAPQEARAWLSAATPEQRMAATNERLLPLLQHQNSEIRLQAQTFLGEKAVLTSEPQSSAETRSAAHKRR